MKKMIPANEAVRRRSIGDWILQGCYVLTNLVAACDSPGDGDTIDRGGVLQREPAAHAVTAGTGRTLGRRIALHDFRQQIPEHGDIRGEITAAKS